MAHSTYDLAVIGSGPAGQKAALTAARMGRRAVLIDRSNSVGGVCIHTGTIPSKALREAAIELTSFQQRMLTRTGRVAHFDISMNDLLDRSRQVVRGEVDVVRRQMARAGVDILYGTASFTSANDLQIRRINDVIEVTAKHILIACGTEPARPKEIPFTPGKIIDSNELLMLTELPESMIIVGGGVIGIEYACTMAAVGVTVTLVESRAQLLEFVDGEIVEALQHRLREMGVRLRLGESVASMTCENNIVRARLASNKELRADLLLYSAGRQGATGQLNLQAAGLAADQRGRLKVNEFFQTEQPHIYAAGDVVGFPALAATSIEQGRIAATHMCRCFTEPPQKLFPYGIYTIPEVSMVGQTEQQLTKEGIPYEIGIARYKETARGQLIADPHGLLKLLFHPHSRRLLGVHAIGTGATELIHIGLAAMHAGLPIQYFEDAVFNYPTLAELYKVAAADGLSRIESRDEHHHHIDSPDGLESAELKAMISGNPPSEPTIPQIIPPLQPAAETAPVKISASDSTSSATTSQAASVTPPITKAA